jgi:hypothetical protein
MLNNTFTHKDGLRNQHTKQIRLQVQAYVHEFETKHQRAPTQNEVGRKFGIEARYAGIVLANLRNGGKIAKTKGKEVATLASGQLQYIRCLQCGEQTCACSEKSETLRGWTLVNMRGHVGVCHKCSKAVAR